MKFRIGQKFEYIDWYTGGRVSLTICDLQDNKVKCHTTYHEEDGVHKGSEWFDISTDAVGEYITICEKAGTFLQIHATP